MSSVLTANVHSIAELNALDSSTESIIVENGSSGEGYVLDFSRFSNLKSLIVGDNCFEYVKIMNMTGLQKLETIKVGVSSFNRYFNTHDTSFSVKNCTRLRELRIGQSSFEHWDLIEIENAPSLEVIQIGYLHYDDYGYVFSAASMELRGEGRRGE